MDPKNEIERGAQESFPLIKFPSISYKPEGLFEALGNGPHGKRVSNVEITGTVKLHGTHADVIIHPGDRVQLQSRNMANLTIEKDNFGFASFMVPLRAEILELKKQYLARFQTLNPGVAIDPTLPLIIAGEWIGPGVEKKVAISKLEKKCYVICCLSINGKWVLDENYKDISNESVRIYNIMRCGSYQVAIDLNNEASKNSGVAFMKTKAKQVEAECPFAKSLGHIGPGEGVVWKVTQSLSRPIQDDEDKLHETPRLWLKTVGWKFKESRTGSLPMPKNSEDMKGHARKFAEACATVPRFEKRFAVLREQIQAEQNRVPAVGDIEKFVELVIKDILEEEKGELSDRGLVGKYRKFLVKAIDDIARQWYLAKSVEKMVIT